VSMTGSNGDGTQDGVVRLVFPARAEYLILARLALAGVSRAVSIPDETLADLKLAITEACGNVVRHAYHGLDGEDGVVRVTIEASRLEISIAVEDEGVGLSAESRTNGDAVEHGESGMGLAIIEAIADEVDVRRTGASGGTLLTLRKRL
jgi:serine/threonine-protein kinase RsbW